MQELRELGEEKVQCGAETTGATSALVHVPIFFSACVPCS